MSMHEDNRVRSTTHTAPTRTTTSTGTVREHTRESEGMTDLMVAPAGWRLSWGAVFAGVIVALVAHLILNLLGLGIGLAGATSAAGLEWLGTGFGIWWTIAGIIAAAIGGWIAGRTLGSADRSDGMIHGLLSWAGATLIIAFLLTGAAGGMLGAQGMQQQAMGPLGGMTGQAGGGQMTQQQQPQPGQPQQQQPGQQPSAQQMIPEQAAGAISGAAIVSFIGLLLGAAAAAAAGRAGVSAARRSLREEG